MELSIVRNSDECLMRNTKLLQILSLDSFNWGGKKERPHCNQRLKGRTK